MQLESNSLKRDFRRFVVPTVLSLLVFSLYSTVDGIFVAKGVSELAMSSVNLCLPFTNFLFSVAVLFAVGTSTIIANDLGKGDRDSANRLFSQNLTVLAILGIAVTVLVFLFLTPFARLLGGSESAQATENTLEYVKLYLMGVAPFSICYMISYNLEVLIKTDGYPKLATISVITGCLTNCVLDYVFIFIFHWGIWGAAFATGLSQLLVCGLYFAHFLGKKCTFHFTRFRFNGKIYGRLLPLGVADGSTELCTGLMLFVFNRVVLSMLGEQGIISYTIIGYMNTLVVMTMVGVSQGMQPLVSYHRGKGNPAACRTLLRYALITMAVMSGVIFAGFFLFAPQLVHIYIGDTASEIFRFSVSAFRKYSISFLLTGFNVVFSGYLIAVERPKYAIIISLGRGFVIQSLCLAAIATVFGGGYIWYTPVLSEVLCLMLSVIFLRRYNKTLKKPA